MLRTLMPEPLPPLPYRPWRRRLRDPLFLLFGALSVITLLALSAWAYTLYRLRVEVGLLRIEMGAHERERQVKDEAWRAEFDTIYRTLYSAPDAPVPEPLRRPSAVELWQKTRDAELRNRIRVLEQWRMRMDSTR
jgi:hypothetical protein